MKDKSQGLIFCVLLALVSYGLGSVVPQFGGVLFCLLLGTLWRSFLPLPGSYKPGIDICAKGVLAYAVVLLGLKLKADFALELGVPVLLMLLGVVIVSIVGSLVLCRVLRIDRATALLIGIGSGICGSSAIAACSKLVTDDDAKVAASLGTINFVGIVGLLLFPLAAVAMNFDIMQSSLLLGGTLQSLGHVAAAGGAMGGLVLNAAISIKMGRVFLLLPTVVLLSVFSKDRQTSWLKKIPFYLWGFIVAMLITNMPWTPPMLIDSGITLGKALLMVAMVGIGYSIDLRTFFKQAPKLVLLGILLQILQILIILPLLF